MPLTPAPFHGSTAARSARALEAVGDDGLTSSEREDMARRYAAATAAPLSPAERAALRDWYARARGDQPSP